jgi:hypothetical protein
MTIFSQRLILQQKFSKILHNNVCKIMPENMGQTFYHTVKDVAI